MLQWREERKEHGKRKREGEHEQSRGRDGVGEERRGGWTGGKAKREERKNL